MSLLERLHGHEPFVGVELRPPRKGLDRPGAMEAWIDMRHAVRRLAGRGRYVFLTDNAVGEGEEENLGHLEANLGGEVNFSRLVPFLTCKHPLDYCVLYAERAASRGFDALTVVGGDSTEDTPRCVPHAYLLREKLRRRVPGLALGGWVNPHRDPVEQVGYLAEEFHGDYFLSQVVSHHDLGRVEAFLEEAARRGVTVPGAFGVFFYRSANPCTLSRLGEFFPVPAAEITAEFEAGATPEEVCARSIRALRASGARHVYLSNLGLRRAPARLERILARL